MRDEEKRLHLYNIEVFERTFAALNYDELEILRQQLFRVMKPGEKMFVKSFSTGELVDELVKGVDC